MRRLESVATTRSSVFAIWITIGFFEVDENGSVNDNELGADIGDVTRHRGFFLVDRSIPVAFEPGNTHNAEKAVLLRRFIE